MGTSPHLPDPRTLGGCSFIARFDELLTRAKSDARALRLAVVGGGAGGVEIACALQWRLLREREQAGITAPLTTVLVSKGPMLRGVTPYARSAFLPLLQASRGGRRRRVFAPGLLLQHHVGACAMVPPPSLHHHQARGIQLIECEGGVVEVSATALLLADGQAVPYDECLWCTSASAVKWLRESGLPADAGARAPLPTGRVCVRRGTGGVVGRPPSADPPPPHTHARARTHPRATPRHGAQMGLCW